MVALIVLGIVLVVIGVLFAGLHILGVLGFWLIVIGAIGLVIWFLLRVVDRSGRRLP